MRCIAIAKTGKQCMKEAKKDNQFCHIHIGNKMTIIEEMKEKIINNTLTDEIKSVTSIKYEVSRKDIFSTDLTKMEKGTFYEIYVDNYINSLPSSTVRRF
jgi:hypothetical protein